MNKFIVGVVFLCGLLAINCSVPETPSTLEGYKLNAPDSYFVLPDTLHEISGITLIDSATFACIEDENGILYIYDAVKNKITHHYTFAPTGDYEAVTRVADTIYVLRSDGMLFEIRNPGSKKMRTLSHYTNIPASNNEGLCYDEDNHRLLIGCKSRPGKGIEFKDIRVIYAFDLKTRKTSMNPVFTFSIDKILQFAAGKNIEMPVKVKDKQIVSALKLSTSEIAIHPLTKELYLLSAVDHMLFIFDMKGNILHVEKLNPRVFNKPEGVTFFSNGDMLISNEGQHNSPTMLRFNYKVNSK